MITVGTAEPISGASPPYDTNDIITYSCASDFLLVGSDQSACSGAPNFQWSLMGMDVPRCDRSE